MSQGTGGWVLRVKCIGCDAAEEFRGVVPALALDRAEQAGWKVSDSEQWPAMAEAEHEACCPVCG